MIILTLSSLSIAAQNQVYELHPVLGDTIDNVEINKYYLFTDYIGDSTDYIIIHKDRDLFSLDGFFDSTMILNIQISKDEILIQKEHVEKLYNYFIASLKKDSFNLNEYKNRALISDSINITNINLNVMTPEFIKSIKKDIKRKFWEEKRKEIKSNQEKGMIY